MQPLHSMQTTDLDWVRLHILQGNYELRAGIACYATIQTHWGGSTYTATTYDATYYLRRKWWSGALTIARDKKGQDIIGTFAGNSTYSRGDFTLAHGLAYHLDKPSFWSHDRQWSDASGQILITYATNMWNRLTHVTITPAGYLVPERLVLTILGQYINIQTANDSAVVTTPIM